MSGIRELGSQSRGATITGTDPTQHLDYVIYGEWDDSAAYDLLEATAPSTYGDLVLNSLSIDPIENGAWLGRAEYKLTDASAPRQSGDSWPGSLQGGTGGATMHVLTSLATVGAYYATGFPAATTDFKQAVNVTKDGVQGTDIVARMFRFTLTKLIPDASVTSAYLTTLYGLTGCVNNGAYQPHAKLPTFAAGELLLEDFRFSQKSSDQWEFQYNFAASPNVSNLVIGDVTVTTKKGWDYLWPKFDRSVVNEQEVQRPTRIYVEQVYPTGSFSGI